EVEEVKASNKIKVNGPKDPLSGSAVNRLTNEKKEVMDFTPGMELNIGGTKEDDITKTEAEKLLKDHTWHFEQVK
ncbi:hypothetical protein R0J90_15725, partial [Micrococcus sp. SIMBA_144]